MDIVYSKDSLIVYLNKKMTNKDFNILKGKLDYIIKQYKINMILFRVNQGLQVDSNYIRNLNDEYKKAKIEVRLQEI